MDNKKLSVAYQSVKIIITEEKCMEFKIICDLRENLQENLFDGTMNFSDHPPKDNIDEIQKMIAECGYECSLFGGIPELIQAVNSNKKFENCIFLNLTDGLDMECGRVQSPILLDLLSVNYSGANPFQAALIDNKYYTKLAVKEMGILVPNSIYVHEKDIIPNHILNNLKLPIIVKPNAKGSSIGITQKNVCFNTDEVLALAEVLQQEFGSILIEEFISGYEVTNFIIGNGDNYPINTPVLEEFHGNFLHNKEVMAIDDKAYRTRTFHLCNQILGESTTETIANASKLIKNGLGVNDILRIDYRITEKGDIYFLEANTVPRICSKNEAGFICKSKNKPYSYIIKCLLETILQRCDIMP